MPTAIKRDATSLRAVPKSDRVLEAELGRDVLAAPATELATEPAAEPATRDGGTGTSVQEPQPRLFEPTGAAPSAQAAQAHHAQSQQSQQSQQVSYLMAPLAPAGYLGTKEEIQRELDMIAMAVRSFSLKQPDQVLRECSAYSARLTELTVLLHRSEDYDRQYTRVRTMQVQKWTEELERQWRTASRLIEVARQDLALLG